MKIKKSKSMEQAKVMKKSFSGYWSVILLFIVVLQITSMVESIPMLFFLFNDFCHLTDFSFEAIMAVLDKYSNPSGVLAIIMLFSTSALIIGSIIYCKKIEKRPLSSMGVTKDHAIRSYLFGLLNGFVMFSLIVLINVLLGGMQVPVLNSKIFIPLLVLYFIGFMIQGASEEFLCRGYLMNSIGANHSVQLAIITSALVFALLHLANPGFSFLAFINLLLDGIFMALYFLCSKNIWGVCANHTIWNFTQGLIFGISVSGAYVEENSIFSTATVAGKDLINGGAFGAEGGIATTIVLLASIIVMIFVLIHKKMIKFKK